MKPRTKFITHYALIYTGLILNILFSVFIIMGKPVEKEFPITIVGFIFIVASFFFFPRKKDYLDLKFQKEQEKKEEPYQKS